MKRTMFSSGQVAAQIGVPRWQLLYLIERGEVPGPSIQVPGRRLFTAADVRTIAQAMADRSVSGPGEPRTETADRP
jgi:hypothetical protein